MRVINEIMKIGVNVEKLGLGFKDILDELVKSTSFYPIYSILEYNKQKLGSISEGDVWSI